MRQAALADGLVWEHYHADWSVDWDYNRDDKTNIFRPWGYQPGHLTEWAKLLLILERHRAQLPGDADWLLPRAVELFDAALAHAWDDELGGIFYGFAPDGSICDGDKYFWVQAESLAAAALLGTANADKPSIGIGTTGSGTTAGATSSTIATAPGTASSPATTASTATRRARPARPTTTPWAPATRCSTWSRIDTRYRSPSRPRPTTSSTSCLIARGRRLRFSSPHQRALGGSIGRLRRSVG